MHTKSTFTALCLALPLINASSADIGYDLLVKTAVEEFSNRCVKTATPFPTWARGSFIIPSVGQFEMGSGDKYREFVGFLDAFGKLHRFEMKGDEVCATYKFMATGFYNESLKEETIGPALLFYETRPPRHCPLWNPMCNLMANNDNTFVNTINVGERMLTITDTTKMVEIDPVTLHVKSDYKFDDKIESPMAAVSSAHPLPLPGTANQINWVCNMDVFTGAPTIRLFTMGGEDPDTRKKVRDVSMDSQPYMHSFGATAKHIVLPRMPIKFDTEKVLLHGVASAFVELNLTEPGQDNAFHIVPLDGSEPIVKSLPIDERLYFTHTVNTYENESGIVIDLVTATGNPFTGNNTVAHFTDKVARDDLAHHNDHMVIKRFHLPLDEKPVTTEVLSDSRVSTDFTRTNPKTNAVKHCYYWGVQWFSDFHTNADMAIVKYDLCTGGKKLEWKRQHWYPSEAIFIPSEEPGSSEDDGLVLFTALDGTKDETWLIAANGKSMESVSETGPFPRIGFTTHGEFFPSPPSKVSTSVTYI